MLYYFHRCSWVTKINITHTWIISTWKFPKLRHVHTQHIKSWSYSLMTSYRFTDYWNNYIAKYTCKYFFQKTSMWSMLAKSLVIFHNMAHTVYTKCMCIVCTYTIASHFELKYICTFLNLWCTLTRWHWRWWCHCWWCSYMVHI